mmetsp:Transcript_3488/g.8667  ORF Transcript_3488/g.8667 Transcript_3488/m.8667 type:complete len:240 (-) Transcript_3488:142-861(-)
MATRPSAAGRVAATPRGLSSAPRLKMRCLRGWLDVVPVQAPRTPLRAAHFHPHHHAVVHLLQVGAVQQQHVPHIMRSIHQDCGVQRPALEHIIGAPALRLEELLPAVVELLGEVMLRSRQRVQLEQALEQPLDVPHGQTLGPPHRNLRDLQVEDALWLNTEVVIQGVNVVAGIEPDLANKSVLQDPLQRRPPLGRKREHRIPEDVHVHHKNEPRVRAARDLGQAHCPVTTQLHPLEVNG